MKVAIFGQSKFEITDKLKEVIESILTRLVKNGVDTFYFCETKDYFDNFCYEIIGKLMQSHRVKRVLARAHFECRSIEEDIFDYLLEFTEDSTFGDDSDSKILTVYDKPFKDIIDLSDVLLTYLEGEYDPRSKCVSKAVKYAKIKRKKIINVFGLI